MKTAVQVAAISHQYGAQTALTGVQFDVDIGEVFGIVGPNGGGKSTLFRILSTLMRPTQGTAKIFGYDILKEPKEVRRKIGVVFQSPGLDKKLTARENLFHQGHLYGLWGQRLRERVALVLSRMGLGDRAQDAVEKLSGGMKRRLDIARSLLHKPSLLLLDEPTVGLDPLIRHDLWEFLRQLQKTEGITILFTTHLLDEAETCDRIALLHSGNVVSLGVPSKLKESLGGDIISIKTHHPDKLKQSIQEKLGVTCSLVDGDLRIERHSGHEFIPTLMASFPGEIESVTLGKPTLEDLFIQKTGHRYWSAEDTGSP